MNTRKEHRKEQGEAAQRDFDILWNDYLYRKAKAYGLLPKEMEIAKYLAKLAFFAGCFPVFREHIADED